VFIIFIIFIIPFTKIKKTDLYKLKSENRYANKYIPLTIKIKDELVIIGDNNEVSIKNYRGKQDYNFKFSSFPLKKNNNMPRKLLNVKFGDDFTNWFKDRFRYRDKLMSIHNHLYFYKHILKDGWMFRTWGTDLYENKIMEGSDTAYRKIADNIIKYKQWCKTNDIKCYIVYVPIKKYGINEKIGYPNDKIEVSDEGKFINKYLKKNNIDFKIISLQEEWLKHNKYDKELIYYKNDIHQTMWASWIEYNKVMNVIKQDFTNLKILKESDFDIEYKDYDYGSECRTPTKLPRFACTKHKYKFYKNRTNYHVNSNLGMSPFSFEKYSNENAQNSQKLIIIGTSFSGNQNIFMGESFREYKRIIYNHGKSCKIGYLEDDCFGESIKKEKPDI
jgi:hypothetical protein